MLVCRFTSLSVFPVEGRRKHLKSSPPFIYTCVSINLLRGYLPISPSLFVLGDSVRWARAKSLWMPQSKWSQLNSHLQRNRCNHNAIKNILIGCKSRFIISVVTAENVECSAAASDVGARDSNKQRSCAADRRSVLMRGTEIFSNFSAETDGDLNKQVSVLAPHASMWCNKRLHKRKRFILFISQRGNSFRLEFYTYRLKIRPHT